MQLRESVAADHDDIAELHRDAFGSVEGPVVAQLVLDLLDDPTAQPLLSLLAIEEEGVVGHVLFTHVTVDGDDVGACILAPLAVTRLRQKQGVGSRLMQRGINILRDRGIRIVLVLGDPAYYSRAGFMADHRLRPPHPLPHPEAWLAMELRDGALASATGMVSCAEALNAPEHW